MGCVKSREEDHNAAGDKIHPELLEGASKIQQAEDAASALGQHQGLSSRLHISIGLSDLATMDMLSKSDPICVVKMRIGKQDGWSEIGRTEIIANSQHPEFVTKINLNYHFEEMQYVRFEVYDVDTSFLSSDPKTIDPLKQDFQGSAEVLLGEMVGASGNGQWSGSLEGSKNPTSKRPMIKVTLEEVANVNAAVTLQLRAEEVASKDLIGKSDPFIKISCMNESGWVPCFKTEVKMNTKQPIWNIIHTSVQQLANGDEYRPLKFECFDYDSNGSHALIGSHDTSLIELIQKTSQESLCSLPLIDPQKQGKSGSSDSGRLIIEKCELRYQPSFLEFINAGAEMSFIVAIDYTASNGDPSTPNSLHYIDPSGSQLNQYAQAILGIGNVIEFYDSDRKFPVFGFGGKLSQNAKVAHCFAANGNVAEPDAHPDVGVAGIMQTYYKSLQWVQLSGPTLFAPILTDALSLARSTANLGKYYVLLILTDGAIHDMPTTIEKIVGGSSQPLSILIVGIGDADFSAMEKLDGDHQRLKSQSGVESSRDTVQFVQMSKFMTEPNVCNQDRLARELLAEIPSQFLSYMKSVGLTPQNFTQNLRK